MSTKDSGTGGGEPVADARLREALTELVACKDLFNAAGLESEQAVYETMWAEYQRRQPLAWEAARRALAAQPVPDALVADWRPVETAPTDRAVLVWTGHSYELAFLDAHGSGWFATWDRRALKPTFWSPLPERPPTIAEIAAQPVGPTWITFTGADEHTSIEGMQALSRQYPIEWGILFSPKRQGEGRYPPMHFVGRLIRASGLRLSAHLCGGHSRDVLEHGASDVDPFIADGFERAQINSASTEFDLQRVATWGATVGARPILQCRGPFPRSTQTAWLFDQSGGRGTRPSAWPEPHPTQISGYAGGINPDNVVDVLRQIKATDFWIDMESGVRDIDDRFSLEACRAVCEAVYGSNGRRNRS